MKFLILLFFIIASAAQANGQKVFNILAGQENMSREAKVHFWANYFTGLPYGAHGPLGEGQNGRFDQDPLYRFDTFDCTTFVETVTSLTLSNNRSEFEQTINDIRYTQGEVSYVTRKHITSGYWIPQNVEAGFFEDVTDTFPLPLRKTASGLIDYPNWLRHHTVERLEVPSASLEEKKMLVEELKTLASDFTAATVRLDYLSIEEVLEDWDLFLSNTDGVYVMNIVRPDWKLRHLIGTNLHVSHQGLLFKQNNELVFIHASSAGKVKAQELKAYLSKYRGHKTIKGINLLRPIF